MIAGNSKPGPFPMADRANIFGTLFVSFYDKWNSGGDVAACTPTFRGILAIAKSKADPDFEENYHILSTESHPCGGYESCDSKRKTLTIIDMDAIVGECWNLMDRIGTWDYPAAEMDDAPIIQARP